MERREIVIIFQVDARAKRQEEFKQLRQEYHRTISGRAFACVALQARAYGVRALLRVLLDVLRRRPPYPKQRGVWQHSCARNQKSFRPRRWLRGRYLHVAGQCGVHQWTLTTWRHLVSRRNAREQTHRATWRRRTFVGRVRYEPLILGVRCNAAIQCDGWENAAEGRFGRLGNCRLVALLASFSCRKRCRSGRAVKHMDRTTYRMVS
jgi:hypothetical protein